MSELNDRFVSNINAIMMERGITSVQLAKSADVPQTLLTRLLRGESRPTLDIVESIARALGRMPLDLLR